MGARRLDHLTNALDLQQPDDKVGYLGEPMPKALDQSVVDALSGPLRNGRYNLLLGAGVSCDSVNSLGPLPSAGALRDQLTVLTGVRPGSSLQRLYDTLTPGQVEAHIVAPYANATAGPSIKQVALRYWRRVFTFNIDDVLQRAIDQFNPAQLYETYNFSDSYSEPADPGVTPIVHLHGTVTRPADGFVFSRSQYAKNMVVQNPWMTVLAQFMPAEPFILIGTSLDEVDLEYYLAQRNESSVRSDVGPSILVEPFPDAATITECERYNLVLYEGTALEFFAELDQRIPERPHASDLVPTSIKELFPASISSRSLAAFAADFELVTPSSAGQRSGTGFLYGRPPTWGDIKANADVSRKLSSAALRQIETAFASTPAERRFVIVADGPGTGKSTMLRRTAYELSKQNIVVLYANSLSRVAPHSTADMLDLIDGQVAVFFDNIADQANTLADIEDRLYKNDILFVGSDRDYRWDFISKKFPQKQTKKLSGLDLVEAEARQLVQAYSDAGLIGPHEARRDEAAFARRIIHDPIAVACCKIMNDFQPLERIVASLVAEARPIEVARYIAVALAASSFRGGLSAAVLNSMTGQIGWIEQFKDSSPLPIRFDDAAHEYIVPVNFTIAAEVLRHLSSSNRPLLKSVFEQLALAIGPRVTRQTIISRSPEAKLSSKLMDYDLTVKPMLGDDSLEFYTNIAKAWRWNSRYWEQLALLHLEHHQSGVDSNGDSLRSAVQHARNAVSIEKHPLSLTTLGKILFASMNFKPEQKEAIFKEALGRLLQAIQVEKDRGRTSVQPFLVLLRGARDYLAMGGALAASQRSSLESVRALAGDTFPRDVDVGAAVVEFSTQMDLHL